MATKHSDTSDTEDTDFTEPELIEVQAFGHRFRELRGNAEDLITLEKEGAVYSHFWDEPSETFRYYRIPFLPREIFEYVEAHVAKQDFEDALSGGSSFEEAVAAIANEGIRQRVLSYGDYGRTVLRDGTVEDLRGCAASFYPAEIEALVCGQRPDRYEILPDLNRVDRTGLLIRVLDNFRVVVRFMSARGNSRPPLLVENEYDVQDLLFVCVRSIFDDARKEEWTPKHAGSSKRIDIVVPSAGALLEAKYVRTRAHAKSFADEIKIDLESYHSYQNCRTVLVLVYDPDGFIMDPAAIERDLSGRRTKGDSSFDVQVLVRR